MKSTLMSGQPRWWLLIAMIFLGTSFGVFLQRFDTTALFFRDLVNVGFDMRELNLEFVRFGFLFGLKINLGTLIGGVFGLWLAR